MSKVGIAVCEKYELEEVMRAMRIVIDKTDFPEVEGKKILVKPNILQDANPNKAISTNPTVVKAMIQILKERNAAKIYVGDSPALQGANFRPKTSGIYQVVQEEGVEWIDFTNNPKTLKIDYIDRNIKFARIIDEIDFSIDLCKFKTHELQFATGAVKNMFGMVPTTSKSRQHVLSPTRKGFAKVVCGIFKESKVSYALMDAVIGMEGRGPANGKPRQIGKLIGSDDAVALDIAEATMMGYTPERMPTIEFAMSVGLTSTTSIESLEYPLLDARNLRMPDFKRIGKDKVADANKEIETISRSVPEFSREKCIGCNKCIQVCPAKALTYAEDHIEIDADKCIRCYCCNEVCPANAISVE